MQCHIQTSKYECSFTNMETELGIAHLKHIERDVLYAIENLSEDNQDIAAKDILEHDLIKSVSTTNNLSCP